MKRRQNSVKKESKKAAKSQLSSPLTTGLCDLKEKYQNEYIHSKPYTHAVIDELCNRDRMKAIHAEITSKITVDYKETDLFKVLQSKELGNISINDDLPELLSLRTALYSDEFRGFISAVTGCNDLIDRVDCSLNAYSTGCHLLCHDDVIGTRRVSYIIYLTDPDDDWLVSDGGALELYPLDSASIVDRGQMYGGAQGIPAVEPTKNILPKFNRMAIFAVQPGRSYHSVQEVFALEKPRLSISGWFHGPTPPLGADAASLNQIMTKGDDMRLFTPIPEAKTTSWDRDKEELSRFVNPTYLEEAAITQINKQFVSESSMQLYDFLHEKLVTPLKSLLRAADEECHVGSKQPSLVYDVGVTSAWQAVGPPHKRRHLLLDEKHLKKPSKLYQVSDEIGKQLAEINKLFSSAAFSRYIQRITALTTTGYRQEIRRFRPGLDYTVAHYGAMTTIPRLDATLCFVTEIEENNEDNEDDEDVVNTWESGDVGGFECYIEADLNTNAEAAEVYRADHTADKEESLLSVSPGFNVLSLVMRDQQVMRFIKYVSAAAPGGRWDIACEYELHPSESNDEDEDEDDEGEEDEEDEDEA